MKLIDINNRFFTFKGEPKKVYYCTDAETDYNLNVKVVNYVRATKKLEIAGNHVFQTRGKEIENILVIDDGLGMPYRPASDVRVLNTITPDSMGYDIHSALDKLKECVGGNITDFVCERLQWSREEITERLYAEQVDAVALAIYNIEARNQAMVVGDQTGIGKGRIASSLVRYAIVNGFIPIYCSENSGLFSDNYRDLVDIGCGNLKPFIINSDGNPNSKTSACVITTDENDKIIVVHKPMPNTSAKNTIFAKQEMPQGFDYILTTYSQLAQAFKGDDIGRDIEKFNFLRALAPKAIFIFDESHNISGSKAIATEWWNPDSEMVMGGSNQFYCFNELAKAAHGVLFLSATFAKRPENMVIYASRTCLQDAELNDTELISSISQGGEALQEVVSSSIVREGQMIRRESTNDDVKVRYITLDKQGAKEYGVSDLEAEHRAKCDFITNIINDINIFEKKYLQPVLDSINLVDEESGYHSEKTSKNMGVSHTPIFSKLFQTVGQLILSIKAEAVANHAIRRLEEGKKVVIGVANTMQTFIQDFDVNSEMAVNCDFSEVLKRALLASRKIMTKDSETGKKVGDNSFISLDQLSEEGMQFYIDLEKRINQASSGLSLSPIDLITSKIEAKKYKVGEVTGRDKKIEFTNKECTKGYVRKRKSESKSATFAKFQNNQLDVLIINVSGSTGASAHATTKNTNLTPEQVKPRVMIVAQAELDINKEVQKRGRINRTGQIYKPEYDYLISAIPAEKRLMMMLQQKLKSLDANSTSNQKQSTTIVDTDDFMNKYGDIVATQYLSENLDINDKLNDPLGLGQKEDSDKAKKVDIGKVTGYVPLLTCAEQEDFYNTILENYKKFVDDLKEQGEYDLEVETMDLDAKLVGKLQLMEGAGSGHSNFADAVYIGNYDCKLLKKPYKQSDIKTMLENYLQDPVSHTMLDGKQYAAKLSDEMTNYYDDEIDSLQIEMRETLNQRIDEYKKKIFEKGGTEDDATIGVEKLKGEMNEKFIARRNKMNALKNKAKYLKRFYAGRACIVDNNSNTQAICLGAYIGNKTKNKFAESNIEIRFAVASPQKIMTITLVKDNVDKLAVIDGTLISDGSYYDTTDYDKKYLDNWNEMTRSASGDRETRQIIVGNILKAYSKKPKGSKLISFTTNKGEILKGLLVPRGSKEENGNKQVLSKYAIGKMKSNILKSFKTGEFCTFNLTRGCSLSLNTDYYKIRFTTELPDTFKRLNTTEIVQLSDSGRGFDIKKQYGKTFYELTSDDSRNLVKLIDLLEKYQFQVELLPSQVEKIFPQSTELKEGYWIPLKVDKSKIPTGNKQPNSSDSADTKRKRALALMLKMKMAKAKM